MAGGDDALVHELDDGGGVGWQQDELDGLKGAAGIGMGSAVVQDKGHFPVLSGENHVLLVKPSIEDVARHHPHPRSQPSSSCCSGDQSLGSYRPLCSPQPS